MILRSLLRKTAIVLFDETKLPPEENELAISLIAEDPGPKIASIFLYIFSRSTISELIFNGLMYLIIRHENFRPFVIYVITLMLSISESPNAAEGYLYTSLFAASLLDSVQTWFPIKKNAAEKTIIVTSQILILFLMTGSLIINAPVYRINFRAVNIIIVTNWCIIPDCYKPVITKCHVKSRTTNTKTFSRIKIRSILSPQFNFSYNRAFTIAASLSLPKRYIISDGSLCYTKISADPTNSRCE